MLENEIDRPASTVLPIVDKSHVKSDEIGQQHQEEKKFLQQPADRQEVKVTYSDDSSDMQFSQFPLPVLDNSANSS